jgi:sugar lactone lactonase YvrE
MTRRVAPALAVAALLLAGLAAPAGAEYRFGYAFGDGAAEGVAVDAGGEVYATVGDEIEKFSPAGTLVSTFGSLGSGAGELRNPNGIAIDPAGNLWVADTGNNRVDKFSPRGAFLATWGWNVQSNAGAFQICTQGCQTGSSGMGNRQFNGPQGIATDPAGDVFVADTGNARVQRLGTDASLKLQFGASNPVRIAVGRDDTAYVTDGVGSVQRFDRTGAAGVPIALAGAPGGVAVDDDGNVYAAVATQIQKFSAAGSALQGVTGLTRAHDTALGPDGSLAVGVDAGVEHIDAVAPMTTIDTAPSGLIEDTSATVGFHASIAGSSFECRMAGSGDDFSPCTSPVTVDGLFPGLNVFEVEAIDPAGIRERAPATADFTVDGAQGPPGLDGFDGLPGERGPRGRRGKAGGLIVKGKVLTALRRGTTVRLGLQPSIALRRVRVELRLGSSHGTVVADGARKRLAAGRTTVVRLRVVHATSAKKIALVVHGRTARGKAVLLTKRLP